MSHSHHHKHSHDHHHHDDAHGGHTHGAQQNVLIWALLLTLAYAFVEAISGWFSGSLALLSDAGHMFSDSAALGFALLGAWVARMAASKQHSYGLMRAEVIVAFINGLAMMALVAYIVIEAIYRFNTPQSVQGLSVMIVAFVGLVINLIVAKKLHAHQHNLNSRAAFLHVLGDLLGSVAAILSGLIIYYTNWYWVDPLLSLLIAALVLYATVNLLREALHVLMEGVPRHLNVDVVRDSMTGVDHVTAVHQMHIWSLSSDHIALSAHVVIDDITKWHQVLQQLSQVLKTEFNIAHVTLQPETHTDENTDDAGCWLT